MHSKKRRIAKTNLLNTLQKAFHLNAQSARQNIPVDEIRETQKISRRKFIETTGKAALLTTIGASAFVQACTSKNKPEIVIVGAGIAGLNAAHTLKKAGYLPKIYEASPRTGGRIYTAVDMLAPGLTTELGGEFIDSTHDDIFALIKQFDLPLIDTFVESEKNLTHACYYFDGQIIKDEDILQLFFPFTDQIQKDIDSLSDVISYKTYNENDLRLDQLSIADYLTGIGISGLLYKLLDVAYTTEYGLDIAEQSAINFLLLMDPGMKEEFYYSGYSDERYKISGGNQLITDNLTRTLQYQLNIGFTLEAIHSKKEGNKIVLDFIEAGGATESVTADFAIITVPFTILKNIKIDYPLSPQKIKAINEMGYGKNAKFFLGFEKRIWREQGFTGFAFGDESIQCGWDNSQLQRSERAGYTIFTGGKESDNLLTGTDKEHADRFLKGINQFFPGSQTLYNNTSAKFHWPTYNYSKASYTCFKPGQYTTIEGAQSEPNGNIYFAGEHCSFDFQGFMNGAAMTGRVAAESILKRIT